jgi:pyruvate/2-oxoacid:ferredoxin oxidoreductase beta subunit
MKTEIQKRNKKFDDQTPHYCAGCGCTWPLSRAHIIRVSDRKDLEMDTENMAYLCLSTPQKKGCHKIWDDGMEAEKKWLNCYDEFMKYIESVNLKK